MTHIRRGPPIGDAPDTEGDTVRTESNAYKRMKPSWVLLEALDKGVLALRATPSVWIEKHEKEREQDYIRRAKNAVLLEAYKETLDRVVSDPFGRQPKIDLPDVISYLEADADGAGTPLVELMREHLRDLAMYGFESYLVDSTTVTTESDDGEPSVSDETSAGLRAIISNVSARQLIGTKRFSEADDALFSIRILGSVDRPKEGKSFEEETVEQILLYAVDGWRRYEKDTEGEWAVVDSGDVLVAGSPPEEVPLVTTYTKRIGLLESQPPFERVAELNIAHYRSDSEQRSILSFARVPIRVITGVGPDEQDKQLVVGPGSTVKLKNPNAKFFMVEAEGSAIQSGERDLENLELKMQAVGARAFIQRVVAETATGSRLDERASLSKVQSWIRKVEQSTVKALVLAARVHGVDVPEDEIKIDIWSDFDAPGGDEDLDDLIRMNEHGKLATVILYGELKRRGTISSSTDVKEARRLMDEEFKGRDPMAPHPVPFEGEKKTVDPVPDPPEPDKGGD